MSTVYTKAQTITNGDFESWRAETVEKANGWFDSNREALQFLGQANVTRVPDASTGSAIRLETTGMGMDTLFGFFSNTEGDPTAGDGGFPYSDKPTSITGSYKSNLVVGDSAIVLVVFKKAGVVISMNFYKLGGVHNTFTNFSFPIDLAVNPDSVVIAAASSDAITGIGIGVGSTITFDNLAFAGPGVTQAIPNGNFEAWSSITTNFLNSWSYFGTGVTKSTDKYQGNFAASLQTLSDNGFTNPGYISVGDGNNNGIPYSYAGSDTLVFHYKYTPASADTAAVFLTLTKGGNMIGGGFQEIYASSNYVKVELPFFNNGQAPDSISISFMSSSNFHPNRIPGSTLILDAVQLVSSPISGVSNSKRISKGWAYPNPTTDEMRIVVQKEGQSVLTVEIFDVLGNFISSVQQNANTGKNIIKISTKELQGGSYFYRLTDSDSQQTEQEKFVVTR